ncbi:hypothetical protein [Winogradskya humida]|uniref:Uncharacterized protein n=1 Tax=Winogradskya humida TaxID=113566 RepID=A0ABQ3ZUJ6_9ACTN|nr:hypothetical protein [Actinoplanes humidus]GIE22277.1 hypothetical protein Ahu01nite_053790 [Actinoplanes humidus]
MSPSPTSISTSATVPEALAILALGAAGVVADGFGTGLLCALAAAIMFGVWRAVAILAVLATQTDPPPTTDEP